MANLRISQLPPATNLQDSDLFAIVQNAGQSLETRKTSLNDLKLSIVASGSVLTYQGTWNASTNTPAIPAASSSNKGWYYVVSVAGTTNIDGVADWQPKDWLVSNGTTWDKVDNSEQYYLDITHANLISAISANSLLTGLLYRITDFQTIHQIPETSQINTGTTEPLVALAVAPNKLLGQVFSTVNPNDIIEYDPNDVLCEDGTTSRKGKITYRKDVVNNLETWYDFREVKFRRWVIDGSGMTDWAATTVYTKGQLVFVSGDGIYKVMSDHTSSANFNDDNAAGRWMLLFNTPTFHLAWKTAVSDFGGSIPANGAVFQDFVTFSSGSQNVSIPKSSQPYNNVVYINSPANKDTFGKNCTNMTLFNGTGLNKFSDDCSGIVIFNSSLYNDIGSNTKGVVIHSGSDSNKIGDSCSVISIANSSGHNLIEGNGNNIFFTGSASRNIIQTGSSYNIIGNGASDNTLGRVSNGNRIVQGSSKNILGNSCDNNFISGGVFSNILGDSCTNNAITGGSQFNIFGNNCDNNNFQSAHRNSIGSECHSNTISTSEHNSLGNTCSSNTIQGNSHSNSLGNSCNGNSFNTSSSQNSLGNGSVNNSFSNSSSFNIIGNASNSNVFNSSSSNFVGNHSDFNLFGSGCNGNRIGNHSNSNEILTISYGSGQYNILENNCNNNKIAGANNMLGNFCSFIVCPTNIFLNGCFFINNVSNKTFVNGPYIVSGLKIMVSTDSVQNLSKGAFPGLDNLVVDLREDGGTLWSKKVDQFGTITTYKFQ